MEAANGAALRVHRRRARRARDRRRARSAPAARRRRRARRVLAEASEALAGPGDLDARLRAVEAAAGAVADRCTIALEEPGPPAPGERRGAAARARRAARHADARRAPRSSAPTTACSPPSSPSAAPRPSTARASSPRPTRPTGCSTRSSHAHRSGSRSTTASCGSCASTTTSPRSTGSPPPSRSGARVGDRPRRRGRRRAHAPGARDRPRRCRSSRSQGSTSAAPGVRREFEVSYWPVRRRGTDEILGVGCVVFEVTERRAADRALREQTARYESLLRALSEVGEAHGRARGRAARLRQPGVPRHQRLLDRGAAGAALDVRHRRRTERDEARRRAQLRLEGVSDPGYQLTLRHRDGHRVPLEIAGVPLEIGGRTQMIVVGRDVTARARAEAEREWLLERAAFLAEASASFDAVLDEERTFDALARLSVRDLADTCVILLGSPGRDPPRRQRRARPRRRARCCASSSSATRSPTAARTRCSTCSPPAARGSSSIPRAPTSPPRTSATAS